MASILKMPKSRAKLPRYGHDLSQRNLFTSSVGHLLPVLYDWLDWGDKISVDERVFTRTQPLKTCAFVRCYEYVDYFFVPMRQIDCFFENAFFGIDDFMDSLHVDPTVVSAQGKNYSVPNHGLTFTFGSFRQFLFAYTGYDDKLYRLSHKDGDLYSYSYVLGVTNSTYLDEFGIPTSWNTIRLVEMLGFGSNIANISTSAPSSNLVMNLHLLAAYQKIFFDYYRVSQWTPNNPFAFSLNQAIKEQKMPSGSERFLVGSVDSIFKLRYRPLKKDFFNNIMLTPLFDIETDVNAYPFKGDPQTVSWSAVNSYLLSNYGIVLQGESSNAINIRPFPYQAVNNNAYGMDVGADGTGGPFNANQMRLMFAYERMLMITQRGGRHVDDQARAHYGVNVPKGISGEVYWLGSHRNDLFIGEVVSTAAGTDGSSSSVLGEIAGRGLGVSDKQKRRIKFTAPCPGILMAIYSCVPDVEYKYTGINKLNLYNSVMDYPRPELDNLGMQPLFAIQSNVGRVPSDSFSLGSINYTPLTTIVGWQYRYSELKLAYDRVQGAFLHTLSDWSSSMIFGQFGTVEHSMYCPPTYLDGIFALSYAPPIVPAADLPAGTGKPETGSYMFLSTLQSALSSSDEYVEVTGPTMASYIWNSSVMYSRDPLLHSIDFSYHKDTYLSTYGLPKV